MDAWGQLRPVTFHLKTDPHGALQYGLIAEEVAKVVDLVRNDQPRWDGTKVAEMRRLMVSRGKEAPMKPDNCP